jgi:hypothetical protein
MSNRIFLILNGILIAVGLYALNYNGLWEWTPIAFLGWYTVFIEEYWNKENEN